jgi:hypothetical protein
MSSTSISHLERRHHKWGDEVHRCNLILSGQSLFVALCIKEYKYACCGYYERTFNNISELESNDENYTFEQIYEAFDQYFTQGKNCYSFEVATSPEGVHVWLCSYNRTVFSLGLNRDDTISDKKSRRMGKKRTKKQELEEKFEDMKNELMAEINSLREQLESLQVVPPA